MTAPPVPGVDLGLAGKVALVSGGGGGIGAATVQALLAAGASVTSIDLPGHEPPRGASHLPFDFARPDELGRLDAELPQRFPRLDVLVHCAGITRDAVLWKMGDEAWSEVLRVNLDSAFRLLRFAATRMRAQESGAVVLVSSINGERGKAGQANYAASKAGLLALARCAARELGRHGVRVNAVAPGLIDTAMTETLPAEVRARAIAESALGHAGRPQDVAAAIVFLCSAMSAHVTGQVLRVDGGQHIG